MFCNVDIDSKVTELFNNMMIFELVRQMSCQVTWLRLWNVWTYISLTCFTHIPQHVILARAATLISQSEHIKSLYKPITDRVYSYTDDGSIKNSHIALSWTGLELKQLVRRYEWSCAAGEHCSCSYLVNLMVCIRLRFAVHTSKKARITLLVTDT